jgi:hypothetical protein
MASCFVLGSGAPGAAIQAFLGLTQLSLDQLTFACGEAAAAVAAPAQQQLALVAAGPGALTSQALAAVSKQLAPGATVYVFQEVRG